MAWLFLCMVCVCSHAPFPNSLYANTRIHATSMLISLSYAPVDLLETHMRAGFSVDTYIKNPSS